MDGDEYAPLTPLELLPQRPPPPGFDVVVVRKSCTPSWTTRRGRLARSLERGLRRVGLAVGVAVITGFTAASIGSAGARPKAVDAHTRASASFGEDYHGWQLICPECGFAAAEPEMRASQRGSATQTPHTR